MTTTPDNESAVPTAADREAARSVIPVGVLPTGLLLLGVVRPECLRNTMGIVGNGSKTPLGRVRQTRLFTINHLPAENSNPGHDLRRMVPTLVPAERVPGVSRGR